MMRPLSSCGVTVAQRRRGRGFTLLEILVVMTLLSVVMVALGASLRTIAKTEERVDQRVAGADEFRVAVSFIRSILGRVSDRRIVAPAQPDAIPFLFSAQADGMAWVGVMPARYGAGGRTFFRLTVEDVSNSKALVVRFLPWAESNSFPDWATADSRVLVSNISSFSLQYEDARATPPEWSTAWTKIGYLPQRILLKIQTNAGPWPDFVIPMMSLSAGASGSGGFTVGGGGGG